MHFILYLLHNDQEMVIYALKKSKVVTLQLIIKMITFSFLGRNRIGVVIMADATYQRTEKSSDPDLNKLLFYAPYAKHIIKLLLFVSSQPKVVFTKRIMTSSSLSLPKYLT